MNARLIAYAVLLLAMVGGVAGVVLATGKVTAKAGATAESSTQTQTSAPAETTDVAEPRAATDNRPARQRTSPSAPRPPGTGTAPPATEPTDCALPTVLDVSTTPALPFEDGWLILPAGAGAVTFTVQATGASEVQFQLTPTGTETASLTTLLGTDQTASDGFTLTWNYPNQSLGSHFSVVAIGPCGRAETYPFNIYHD